MPLIARFAVVLAGGAIAGSSLAAAFPFGASLAVPLTFLSLIIIALMRTREARAQCAVALLGIALGSVRATQSSLQCARYDDGAHVVLRGAVETRADETHRSVQIRTSNLSTCTGSYRVGLPDNVHELKPGERIIASGSWTVLRVAVNGRPASDGMLIATRVTPDYAARTPWLLSARGKAQQRLRTLFPAAYPVAEALLVSQREALDADVRESFATSGLTHLLAISGSHVALVAGALVAIAGLLRLPVRAGMLLSMLGSAAYVIFLGAPFAAVRSLIQMTLLLLSRLLQRPAHPVGLLAGAAILIIVMDPAAPLDAGFQLSFAGILGIILWRRPLIDLMPRSIPAIVRDAIATTCAATCTTTPIAAYHFGVVSVIALIANLLAAPVVALAVPAAALVLALSAVSMDAAQLLAPGAELALLWLTHIAQLCAAVPGGHFYLAPTAVVASTAAVLLAYSMLRGTYRSTLTGRAAVAALGSALCIVAYPLLVYAGGNVIEIGMIDVGQGDAFAIRSPHGRWLLVDAGPSSNRYDAGKSRVVPFLVQHNATRIEAILISHPDLDHFGGARAVTQRLEVGAVADPTIPVAKIEFDSLVASVQRRRIQWLQIRTGNTLAMDGMRLDFLGPDSVTLDASHSANDYSAAFRLSYGRFSALFLGDMSVSAERRLVVGDRGLLDVDVLKVAHHGSGSSSSEALLAAASPRVALLSVGRRNRYGHPNAAVLARIEASGARIFRTDRDGSVTLRARKDGTITVRTGQ